MPQMPLSASHTPQAVIIRGARLHDLERRAPAALWMGGSFSAALAVVIVVFLTRGAGEAGTIWALRLTARLGFLLFWGAYAGSALAALFGPPFAGLRRRGRVLGLAFAAVLVVHLGAVTWLSLIGHAPDLGTFVFFGSAAACVFALALFSIDLLHRNLRATQAGAATWWLLRVVGMNFVLYAFAVDFFGDPLRGGAAHAVMYWPFIFLIFAGPLLRLASLIPPFRRSRSS